MKNQQGASWLQLIMVFMLSLLLFIAIRWQPEPWLRSRIDLQASQSGISLQYEQMHIEGFTVRLEQVSVQAAGQVAPLELNSLSLSPEWALLLNGSLDIQLLLNWQGQRGRALLNWRDDYIDIHGVEAELDVSLLQTLWDKHIPLPVHVSGQVQISGGVRLDIQTGRPLRGSLDVGWTSAGFEMASGNTPLGDYQLAMTVDETSTSWRWILDGGEAVVLQGEGMLGIPPDVRQAWPVSGQARIKAGKKAGVLSAMLGSTPLLFSLSGSTVNPKLQRM